MTKFILVRHGEPTYKELISLGYKGNEFSWAPLTSDGIKQISETASNDVFADSDILISSPYTRAMQSASIIGNKYNLMINPEILLHEWIADYSNSYTTEEEFLKNIRQAKLEFEESNGNSDYVFSDNFEPIVNVRKRALMALEKYCNYDKVIVVAHGLLISTLFKDKIRLKTGDFVITTSDELESNFDFKPKVLKK